MEEQRIRHMGGLFAKSQGHGRQLGCACYGQGDTAPLANGVQVHRSSHRRIFFTLLSLSFTPHSPTHMAMGTRNW